MSTGYWIKCPKCGDAVYVPTYTTICARCNLLIFPNGETMPAPQTAHHNYACDVVRGPCTCGAWHEEQEQIDKSTSQAETLKLAAMQPHAKRKRVLSPDKSHFILPEHP